MKGDSDYVFDIVGRSLPPRAMDLIRKLDYIDEPEDAVPEKAYYVAAAYDSDDPRNTPISTGNTLAEENEA